MQTFQLIIEVSHPNDVSNQLGDEESAHLLEQDQDLLADLYGAKLKCFCTSPPVNMHIKHRVDETVGGRFWLSDNPGSETHDIECALYSHKLAPKDVRDPYRLNNAVSFRIAERNQDRTQIREVTKTAPKAQNIALKPLLERIFYHLYQNSFAGYYFGGCHDVGSLVRQFQRSDINKKLLIDDVPAPELLFYGMKGLAIMKRRLREESLAVGIWLQEFSRYENKDGGFMLDAEFFPSKIPIANPKKKGPFMLVSAWTDSKKPVCHTSIVVPIADKELALPVMDIKHRNIMLEAGRFISESRNEMNRLYLMQPYPIEGAVSVTGEIIKGNRVLTDLHVCSENDGISPKRKL